MVSVYVHKCCQNRAPASDSVRLAVHFSKAPAHALEAKPYITWNLTNISHIYYNLDYNSVIFTVDGPHKTNMYKYYTYPYMMNFN